jgi:hypothetical protein
MNAPKPVFEVTRQEHLNHLQRMMPLLAGIYLIQCFLLLNFITDMPVGDICFLVAIFISVGICGLYAYDNYQKTLIFGDSILSYFELWGGAKIYSLSDIKTVRADSSDLLFGHLEIEFKNGERLRLYFIDRTSDVAKLIEKLVKDQKSTLQLAA